MFLFLADGGREERKTEEDDDGQIHHHTKQRYTHCVGKGDGDGVFKEPGAPCHHVPFNGLHLEVGAEDPAHMEELMAVTCRGSSRVVFELRQHNVKVETEGVNSSPKLKTKTR